MASSLPHSAKKAFMLNVMASFLHIAAAIKQSSEGLRWKQVPVKAITRVIEEMWAGGSQEQ